MEEIIRVTNLHKFYGDIKAVDNITFSVYKGELFGFLGENGAGKTTTISMLCTLLKPTYGQVRISGFELGREDDEIKKRIGVVYQDNCLDDILTVKENLFLRGQLYETDAKELKKNLEYICETLELKDLLKRKYGKLSGGQKRRCEIARALLHKPEILFLDEPTTGLDPASRKNVWEAIHKLQKDMGMTVFLTTHYMEEAAKADHIGIMRKGHLTQYGTPFELKEKYAKDKLIIIPKEERFEQVAQILRDRKMEFKEKANTISAYIDATVDSLPILDGIKDCISGFEVIQGSMDDVFLNITQGDGDYE